VNQKSSEEEKVTASTSRESHAGRYMRGEATIVSVVYSEGAQRRVFCRTFNRHESWGEQAKKCQQNGNVMPREITRVGANRRRCSEVVGGCARPGVTNGAELRYVTVWSRA